MKLLFGFGNAKLSKTTATFSLPAGHSCRFAKDCFSKANKETGKVTDGKCNKFRCFSVTSEARHSKVRKNRWKNFELLKKAKTIQEMANLIQFSLPQQVQTVRLHVAGDFFNENYFKAWLNVAIANPTIVFYTYTKALTYWIKYRKFIPSNFRLTASKGGTHDYLIEEYNLKFAEVVFSEFQAKNKKLKIDHDDSLAKDSNNSFALLLHGTQPPKTKASKAWTIIKKLIGGYSKKNTKKREMAKQQNVKLVVK